MFRKAVRSVILACSVSVIGCATISGDKTQSIPISSTPNEATISVTDEHGREVFKGKTPSYVMLKKKRRQLLGQEKLHGEDYQRRV